MGEQATNTMPPSSMMKLSEAWGEPKNLFKGEDDRFKIEEGEGQEEPN